MKNAKINFTKATIDALPIAAKGNRLRVYDVKSRGLLLDITPTGQKCFWLRRNVKGKSEWLRLGTYPDLTIERARAQATIVNGAIASGSDLKQAIYAKDNEPNLEEAFEAYLNKHAMKTNKTWDAMKKDFELKLACIKGRKLSSITPQDVEALHMELGTKRGTYSANRSIQLLRAIYNKAIVWRLFEGRNPCIGITLYKEKARTRFLSKEEVRRLLTALQTETNVDLRDFVWLSLLTGARKTNILTMKWREINFEDRTWIIPDTKNGQSQIIALSGYELELLHNRQNGDEYVFPGKAGFLKDPKKSWHALLRRAEINDCTLHDLRRNLAAWMASKNVNVSLIKGALNHKDLKTTMFVYAHTVKEAELEGRMVAHQAMFEAAGIQLLGEERQYMDGSGNLVQ